MRSVFIAALLQSTLVPVPAFAQPDQLFLQRCSGCHTIGDGVRVGPDLIGVTTRREKVWIEKFVRTPGAVIDAGDPIGTELLKQFNGMRMPDQDLTDPELQGLITFLSECTDRGGCKPAPPGPKLASDAKPEEIALGRALFTGRHALENGGSPCIGCHDVRGAIVGGGGTWGSDLTFAYARLGDQKLSPLLAEMSTPVMASLYANAPLTDSEQYAIKAYLWNESRNGSKHRPDRDFVWLGIAGLGAVLGFVGIVWGGRNSPRTRT